MIFTTKDVARTRLKRLVDGLKTFDRYHDTDRYPNYYMSNMWNSERLLRAELGKFQDIVEVTDEVILEYLAENAGKCSVECDICGDSTQEAVYIIEGINEDTFICKNCLEKMISEF